MKTKMPPPQRPSLNEAVRMLGTLGDTWDASTMGIPELKYCGAAWPGWLILMPLTSFTAKHQ
jgi:hypothetical protein